MIMTSIKFATVEKISVRKLKNWRKKSIRTPVKCVTVENFSARKLVSGGTNRYHSTPVKLLTPEKFTVCLKMENPAEYSICTPVNDLIAAKSSVRKLKIWQKKND